jgi:hypothetical protein
MCYSAITSLQTYAVALLGFVLGWIYGFSRPYLWFGFIFSQMQLVEYFLWKSLKNKNSFWNRIFSIFGLFIIFLEPIFALRLSGPNLPLILAYLILITVAYLFSSPLDLSTKIGVDGHLHWNFLPSFQTPMIWIWMAFFFYGLFVTGKSIVYLLALTTIVYAFFKTRFQRTWSSYWCFLANLFWLYVIAWALFWRK